MPEMLFDVRWPDGHGMRCYSPSLIIKEYFEPGRSYPVEEFLRRSREAFRIADERVRARFGFGCGHGQRTLQDIEQKALACPADGLVTVERFEE